MSRLAPQLGAIALGTVLNQDFHVGAAGWPLVILGSFLVLQTTRIRFRFSDTDLEVVSVSGLQEEGLTEGVESSGENMLQVCVASVLATLGRFPHVQSSER